MTWSELEEYAEFNCVFLENVRASFVAGQTAAQAAASLEIQKR